MAPDRTSVAKVTPETVNRMAVEVVGVSIDAKHRQAIAELLQALAVDMAALKRLDVGAAEPAFVFDAGETAS